MIVGISADPAAVGDKFADNYQQQICSLDRNKADPDS